MLECFERQSLIRDISFSLSMGVRSVVGVAVGYRREQRSVEILEFEYPCSCRRVLYILMEEMTFQRTGVCKSIVVRFKSQELYQTCQLNLISKYQKGDHCMFPCRQQLLTMEVKIKTNPGNPRPQHNKNNKNDKRIQMAANQIIAAARRRKNRGLSPKYQPRGAKDGTIYEQAKTAETIDRNLHKAALLYGDAAQKGEKIDSCIKDFASIVHQMGQTEIGVRFLEDARPFYRGDLNKFDRLLVTLERQINPSGKHHCKRILFELPALMESTPELLKTMFANTSRVKGYNIYSNLNFDQEPEQKGKWLILDFDSFSAGKKTLEKFVEEDWFGVNKFWMKGNLVVCLATDGREDFENGMVITEDFLEKKLEQESSWFWKMRQSRGDVELRNLLSIAELEGCEHDESELFDEVD